MANQRGETTSIGHFWNRCVDTVNNLFETISFWTSSKDVEFADGNNAETKVGAIKGITSDFNTTDAGYAASMTAVSELNNSLGGLKFGTDGDGNYGYYGADGSLVPFKSVISQAMLVAEKESSTTNVVTASYTNINNCECVVGVGGHDYTYNSDGIVLFNTGAITAGGAHKMGICCFILGKGQHLTISGWNNVRIYRLT